MFIVALTVAIASIGSGGLIGVLATLGIVGMASKLAVDYGYDGIVIFVIKEQLKTKSKEEALAELQRRYSSARI